MIYVKYDLKWRGNLNEIGDQPYQLVADNGAEFDGGIFVKEGVYFGYIKGENADKALTACEKDFKMVKITQKEALFFFKTAYPEDREVVEDGITKEVSRTFVDEYGIIKQDLSIKQDLTIKQ